METIIWDYIGTTIGIWGLYRNYYRDPFPPFPTQTEKAGHWIQVSGFGSRVSGSGFRVSGLGHKDVNLCFAVNFVNSFVYGKTDG